MQGYYNTNREASETLEASLGRASYQRDQVLAFFQANPGRLLAPHEVHQAIADEGTPLTSIRRAITDLTELGYLEKTLEMRIGDLWQAGSYMTA